MDVAAPGSGQRGRAIECVKRFGRALEGLLVDPAASTLARVPHQWERSEG